MLPNAADISLDQIDLSDLEFWAGPRDVREATFKLLRDTPELQHFEEHVVEGSPFPRVPATTHSPDTKTSGP